DTVAALRGVARRMVAPQRQRLAGRPGPHGVAAVHGAGPPRPPAVGGGGRGRERRDWPAAATPALLTRAAGRAGPRRAPRASAASGVRPRVDCDDEEVGARAGSEAPLHAGEQAPLDRALLLAVRVEEGEQDDAATLRAQRDLPAGLVAQAEVGRPLRPGRPT